MPIKNDELRPEYDLRALRVVARGPGWASISRKGISVAQNAKWLFGFYNENKAQHDVVKLVTESYPKTVTYDETTKLLAKWASRSGEKPPTTKIRLKVFSSHPIFVNVEKSPNSIKAMLHPTVKNFCAHRGTKYFTRDQKDEVLAALSLKQKRNATGHVVQDEFLYRETGAKWCDWGKLQIVAVQSGIHTEVESNSANEEEYQTFVKELDDSSPLDEVRQVSRRREQTFIRKVLLGGRTTGECCICAAQYPIELLVAAHVKMRKFCSEDEKRSYKNNVFPMCRLGCDQLFELGYLTVLEGTITTNPNLPTTDVVRNYLERVARQPCKYWNSDSAQNFKWHHQFHLYGQNFQKE